MNIAVSPVHSLFEKTLNECFSSIVSLRVLGERRRLWDHFRDHVRSPGPRLLQNSKDSYQIVWVLPEAHPRTEAVRASLGFDIWHVMKDLF
jgi:hypothetical protein